MKKFVENNGRIDVVDFHEGTFRDSFRPSVYIVSVDNSGFFLKHEMDKFELPEKIYGSTNRRADKICATFNSRDNATTGVMLTGLKGSGKTFLMKKVANNCIDMGVPVVMVNDAFSGSEFISFINGLGEVVVIFDEFAKNYKRGQDNTQGQESLLTLFDGVASGKRMIMISDNDLWDISSLYKNRPSRIYYSYKYEKLEREMVEEYSKDNLNDEKFVESIVKLSDKTAEFSFDVLQTVIEECNRYPDEQFDEIIRDLNISASENKRKIRILSAEGVAGKYKGVKFIPAKTEVGFDDFHTNVNLVSDRILEGRSSPDNLYVDLDADSFDGVNERGRYVFYVNDIMVVGEIVEDSFSRSYLYGKGIEDLSHFREAQMRRNTPVPTQEDEEFVF